MAYTLGLAKILTHPTATQQAVQSETNGLLTQTQAAQQVSLNTTTQAALFPRQALLQRAGRLRKIRLLARMCP